MGTCSGDCLGMCTAPGSTAMPSRGNCGGLCVRRLHLTHPGPLLPMALNVRTIPKKLFELATELAPFSSTITKL